jgi:uncharacterized protein YggU (UPF0235/DUF167 family)
VPGAPQGHGASPRAAHGRPWRQPDPPAGPILLRVRVTPKAGADRVSGLIETPDGPAIRIQVRAAPADGAANKAVITTIAKSLGRAKSSVTLAAGARGRTKTLALDPLPGTIEALEALNT